MKGLRVIVLKEIRDNLRDRRSLFFALLYGPVLLPLLLIGPLLLNAGQLGADRSQVRELPTLGATRAENLTQFLRRNNLDVVEPPADAMEALSRGEMTLLLEIPESYPEDFRAGRPAHLIIHYNSADDDSLLLRRQLQNVLTGYDAQLRNLRLLARGLDPQRFVPLEIDQRDVSNEPQGLQFIAHMIPFLLLFSMMMGGFYLAVDTTAGERERNSLEPLLSLPLPRHTVVLGKYLAILCFVLLSLLLPLLSSFGLFRLLPDDMLDGALEMGTVTFFVALVSSLPLAFLLTAFLLAIAAFARNSREAQTHLSLAMLLPMLPFFGLQFLDIQRDNLTMMLPMLSQFQIMELAVTGRDVPLVWLALSAAGTLTVAALLLGLALRLYSRERILM